MAGGQVRLLRVLAAWAVIHASVCFAYQLHSTSLDDDIQHRERGFPQQRRPEAARPSLHVQSSHELSDVSGENVTAKVLMGVDQNGQGDLVILESTFVVNAILWFSIMAFFCFLVRLYPAVYTRMCSDADHEEQLAPPGLIAKVWFYGEWFREVYGGRLDGKVVEEAGLDGLMFLKYQALLRWILLAIAPPIVTILCPMHVFLGMPAGSVDALSRLGINNLALGSQLFWVHVVFVYYVVVVAVLFIVDAQQSFVKDRYHWLRKQAVPQAKTILVEGIPVRYRSEKKLRHFFEDECAFGKEAIERVYVVRKAGVLYKLVDQLNVIEWDLLQARSSGAAGAIEDLEKQQEAQAKEIDRVRDRIHDDVKAAASAEGGQNITSKQPTEKPEGTEGDEAREPIEEEREDCSIYSAAAFVTFATRYHRRRGLKEQFSSHKDEFRVSAAPDPSDVYYSNLALMPAERDHLDILGRLSIMGIFFAWMPCVVALLGFTDLRTLQNHIPVIAELCEKQPALEAVFEGVAATWALQLFMGLLPTLLLFIIRQFFASSAGAHAQFHMQYFHFIFQILFVVLVTAIGKSLFYTTKVVARHPDAFLDVLALSMPTSSHFYLQYVILGWFSVALEQLRISNLLKYIAFRAFMTPQRAKEYAEPESDTSYGMGTRFANTVTFSTITFCFCTCSPLICIFAWVYFRLSSITYTYLLCKVETKKPDLGGEFWVQALKHTFVGLIIFVILMAGILEERGPSWRPGVVASGALVIVYWGWERVNSVDWLHRSLPSVVQDDKDLEDDPASYVGQYMDPCLMPAKTKAVEKSS